MSNNLNQYTSIQEASEAAFTPQFDADGNKTPEEWREEHQSVA